MFGDVLGIQENQEPKVLIPTLMGIGTMPWVGPEAPSPRWRRAGVLVGSRGPTPLGVVTWAGTGSQTCKPQSAWSFISSRTGKGVGASRRGLLWGSRRGIERGVARTGFRLPGQGPASCPVFDLLNSVL